MTVCTKRFLHYFALRISLTQHIFLAPFLETGGHVGLAVAAVCQIAADIEFEYIIVLALHHMGQIRM